MNVLKTNDEVIAKRDFPINDELKDVKRGELLKIIDEPNSKKELKVLNISLKHDDAWFMIKEKDLMKII